MKYLAFGYDGNGYIFKTIHAAGAPIAVAHAQEAQIFGAEGELMLLIETPARVHYLDADGTLGTKGSY